MSDTLDKPNDIARFHLQQPSSDTEVPSSTENPLLLYYAAATAFARHHHSNGPSRATTPSATTTAAPPQATMTSASRPSSLSAFSGGQNDAHWSTTSASARYSQPFADSSASGSQPVVHPDRRTSSSLASSESALWAWDTPLENVGESSSYYYELQGELLHDHPSLPDTSLDLTIPHPACPSGTTASSSKPAPALKTNDGFAIPTRPSEQRHNSAVGAKRKAPFDPTFATPHAEGLNRTTMSDASEGAPTPASRPSYSSRSQSGTIPAPSPIQQRPAGSHNEPQAGTTTQSDSSVKLVLPPRKVFPVQVGDKLFRLSGASLSSDAPSYFSQFFEEQLRHDEEANNIRTLYIGRDPAVFEDIALHLKGYHVQPRNGSHFVKLFADAQFYSLPRLTAQLFAAPIYIRIGDTDFQIPRDLFNSPGDSPNYFTLGFSSFFTTPTNIFPGLNQRTLLRPPSILPPSVPHRSAKTFADILHLLQGYPLEIRDRDHREELLRDAKYFHLKGLEQKLISHNISYNLARKRSEILIRLEDIRQSGLSVLPDESSRANAPGTTPSAAGPSASGTVPPNYPAVPAGPGWVSYQRPYVDTQPHALIIEISGNESCHLSIAPGPRSAPARFGRATFFHQTLTRIISLLSVIANKMNLPIVQPLGLVMEQQRQSANPGTPTVPPSPSLTGISDERVKVRIGMDADVQVNGRQWLVGEVSRRANQDDDTSGSGSMDVDSPGQGNDQGKRRRPNDDDEDEGEEWIVQKAQWRIRVQPVVNLGAAASATTVGKNAMEAILSAVKIEAFASERRRNESRAVLT